MVPFIFLFVPETAFNRQAALEREKKSHHEASLSHNDMGQQQTEVKSDQRVNTSPSDENVELRESGTNHERERDEWFLHHRASGWGPFFPQLRLFIGRINNESFWKILLRPFPLMLHPGVLWGCITQGTLIVFLVSVGAVIALLFGGSPRFFPAHKIGYIYVGPFIGGLLGFAIGIILPQLLSHCQLVYYPIIYAQS
jgi:hypothetical protein